jgi:hypothetical protein
MTFACLLRATPTTLTIMENLASTYQCQGRWADAEKMGVQVIKTRRGVQVMETRRRIVGKEHPDTLTSMNNLAFTMKEQGRKIEAIKLMARCVQLCNKVLVGALQGIG